MSRPILYSFRRCPYAMRARLGLLMAHQDVELREIILKHKPAEMLEVSPKGTVPVLILTDGSVIDESLDIMLWALQQQDEHQLLFPGNKPLLQDTLALVNRNDCDFKSWLDKYKYADRYPDYEESYYRQHGEHFIALLETRLSVNDNLMSSATSLADYAIFPFVRQFAHVNLDWWCAAPYPKVRNWLDRHISSHAFSAVMKKYPTWLESGQTFNLLP